jgi:hypothetical protein
VVDDFLETIPKRHLPLLVSCTAAFGRQVMNDLLSSSVFFLLQAVGLPAGTLIIIIIIIIFNHDFSSIFF